jgi:hypothetical protein
VANLLKQLWINKGAFVIGAFLSTMIHAGIYYAFYHAPDVPYGNIERVVVERISPTEIHYKANFVKYREECKFQQLVPFLIVTGEFVKTQYVENTGRGNNDNRAQGQQSLNINIDTKGLDPEVIELRTRHVCEVDGKQVKVTKIFDRFKTP